MRCLRHVRRAPRRRGRAHCRNSPQFNLSFRPIIAETEAAAWDRANGILDKVKASIGPTTWRPPKDESGKRILRHADLGDLHDECLWMPIAAAFGAIGNTTCLVGTPEQVANACLAYYRMGVDGFLLRGFDPLNDAIDFGRELIPRIRAGVADIDRTARSA